ncbi:hypothetical protein [Micromonospora sp. NPDC049175]|uniref:hypothetical protein n=1 Tax=unclassified Micromonospora TaxID=2617518 RepID=UPI0037134F90
MTGPHPADATRATAGTNPLADPADALGVAQVTWTSAPHIAADVPERHRHA